MIERLDLHAYADRELDAASAARIEQELASDPTAQRELEAIQMLKTSLRERTEASDTQSLWDSCRSRLDELDRVSKAETFVSKYAWALAGVLFVVIFTGGLLNRGRASTVGMGTVASYASELIPSQSPRMSMPTEVQSWISSQTGQRPTLFVDPSQVIAYTAESRPEGRVVRFRLRAPFGVADLMVIPNVSGVDGVRPVGDGIYAGQVNGVNFVTWPDSGCAIFLIGDRDPVALRDFARSLYR